MTKEELIRYYVEMRKYAFEVLAAPLFKAIQEERREQRGSAKNNS